MRKIAKVPPALLSILMVFTPVSVSACDLSCWLRQTSSDCHSTSSDAEDGLRMTSRSSAMDMSADMEMSSDGAQSKAGPHESAQDATGHLMSAQMDMIRSARQVISKAEVSGGTGFDQSRALSPCSHETCSQATTSVSPPSARQSQSVNLYCAVMDVSSAANLLTTSHRIARGSPPPINHPADLLPTLRI
jgi:hypothetical protein